MAETGGPDKFNLALPKMLMAEFVRIAARQHGKRRKGDVYAAAMLMFLEASPAEQDQRIENATMAKVRGDFTTLIRRARDKATAAGHRNGPVVDLALIDEDRNPVGEEPAERPARGPVRKPKR